MLAPSATSLQPFLTSVRASSASIFVLRGAGEGQLGGDSPRTLVRQVRHTLEVLGIFANPPPPDVLQFHDPCQLFGADALLIHDGTIEVGKRDGLGAQLD